MGRHPPADGQVIEGEAVVVEEWQTGEARTLPGEDAKP
jgi:high-affinity K+ transport system ATPase subunit B